VPGNPLVAHALYLNESIEAKGVGTLSMIEHCRKAGLRHPEFKAKNGFSAILHRPQPRPVPPSPPAPRPTPPTPRVPDEVRKLLMVCQGEMTREELQKKLHLKGLANFRRLYFTPALEGGYIEMTIPGKPNSRLQMYRLTAKGRAALAYFL